MKPTKHTPRNGRTITSAPTREIRATHPDGFRSGQWATLVGRHYFRGRLCYLVRFPDGTSDWWPVNDPSDQYEFRP